MYANIGTDWIQKIAVDLMVGEYRLVEQGRHTQVDNRGTHV